MEHNQAVQIQAVERYLLNQLPADERDAFEEHFFTCTACAEDLRAGARFRSSAREVLRRGDFPHKPGLLQSWFVWPSLAPTMAALALVAVVGYQSSVTIPDLKRGRTIDAVLLSGTNRGPGDPIPEVTRGSGAEFFTVYFEWPLSAYPAGGHYEISVADSSGKTLDKISSDGPKKPGDSANLLLSSSKYGSGIYTVTLRQAEYPSGNLLQLKFKLN